MPRQRVILPVTSPKRADCRYLNRLMPMEDLTGIRCSLWSAALPVTHPSVGLSILLLHDP